MHDPFLSDAAVQVSPRLNQNAQDHQTLYRLNQHKTVVQLIEEQAAVNPDQIAIVHNNQQVSYIQLNAAANQLARWIQQQIHIEPDTIIGLFFDNSPELIISLLAILKVGAAYVPLDSETPPERIRFILKDTNAPLLLTHQQALSKLPSALKDIKVVALDQIDYHAEAHHHVQHAIGSSHLAYVMYTSGTTGMPKGVMITHHNLINYHANVAGYFDDLNAIDFSTSIAFDLSVTTTLIPLMCGKTIVIYSGDRYDVLAYVAHLKKHHIEFIKSTPSYLMQVFSLPQSIRIKRCFVGGEKLLSTQLQQLLNHVDEVYDEYGPTENTVGTTCIRKLKNHLGSPTIGKPYFNQQVYVLDENRQLVAEGEIGELYVGGANLARGYLNQPALTAERFIDYTNASQQTIRIYRTGDLVRLLAAGELEYIGRNDTQLKLNGYRIELNEIDYALQSYPSIQQAVVLVINESKLIAFYLSEKKCEEAKITAHLQLFLPHYMLPCAYYHLTELPLTLNGKLDRNQLIQLAASQEMECYQAAQTSTELLLCTIWQDVLGLPSVGVLDDFFKLGGDSIKCMQVIAALLRQQLHCRVQDFFAYRCIQQLAPVIQHLENFNAESGLLTGHIPLSPIQSWFFAQLFPQPNYWNQAFFIRVPKLSLSRLQSLLPDLISQHDCLRVIFPILPDGRRDQVYQASLTYPVTINALTAAEMNDDILDASHSQFDLENGPLWQLNYISGYPDGSARLHFVCHHLLIDSVSWRIIIDDLWHLYEGKSLGEKGSSYRQWSQSMQQYAARHPKEYAFWQQQLSDSQLVVPLSDSAFAQSISFPPDITRQLLGAANRAYHTEINDLLLSALLLTLARFFNRSDVCLTLEGHGREEVPDQLQLSRTVGWFTSMFPIRLTLKTDFATTIQAVKEYLRAIPNKGIGFNALKYAENTIFSLADLPNITFNYLGQFDQASGYWQVVNESTGEWIHADNKRPHVLDMLSMVVDGSFQMSLSSYLSQAACDELSELYYHFLSDIIVHCMDVVKSKNETFTASDFQAVKLTPEKLTALQQQDASIVAIHPANSLQQGFIYHVLTQPHDDAYRIQLFVDYSTDIDIACYQQAWQLAIASHPILRTYFDWDVDLLQLVTQQGKLAFHFCDLTDHENSEEAIDHIQKQDRLVAFDLSKPTLMRLHLMKTSDTHYVLLHTAHHSILDGLSVSNLFKQVHLYYVTLIGGQQPTITIDNSYLRAQSYIAKHQLQVDSYWQSKLQRFTYTNDLNPLLSQAIDLDQIKSLQTPAEQRIEKIDLDFQRLKKASKKEGFTLNVMVQFAWHKLIQLYTNDDQTIIGTTVSGRTLPIAGMNDSVGLFINTLPLLVDWLSTATVRDQLKQIEIALADINDHSFASLAALQQNGKRLFYSLVIADVISNDERQDAVIPHHFRDTIETLDYPLVLVVREISTKLIFTLKYDAALLTHEKAALLLEQLSLILDESIHKFDACPSHITALSKVDYQRIVYDWNHSPIAYTRLKSATQLIEAQALKTPDAIALRFESQSLTYSELNKAANRLARYLRQQHLTMKPNTLIALCIQPSIDMVVSLLAILKAGAAYVPIDPCYPIHRIQQILKEADCAFVLTDSTLLTELTTASNQLFIAVDQLDYQSLNPANLPVFTKASDLSYVIYTSGSTGKPKGVMVTQQNLAHYLSFITHNEAYQRAAVVDCSSSIAFDATIAVLLAPLTLGCQVVLCDEATKRDAHRYLNYLHAAKIELLRLTPSYLSALLFSFSDEELREKLAHVRCLMLGGEKAIIADIRLWFTVAPQSRVINHYGPTETTVACAVYTITSLEHAQSLSCVPIGAPSPYQQLYVLNAHLQPVPIGVAGELYVGGQGVACGYLKQPALTADNFITNPYAKLARLYKTGDSVRWLPDGTIEYLGRLDHQVKIRGYRVELAEIEQAISNHPAVAHCVVTYDGTLVAYYVALESITSDDINQHVTALLPSYMIPNTCIRLDMLPLTINGKIDRKALPQSHFINNKTTYQPPQTETEAMLCQIWQEMLAIPRVGIHDDFFSLGGHSILAIRLAHRISQATERQIAVSDIFKTQTIAAMSALLNAANPYSDIVPNTETNAPLSYAQERLWFIEQYEGGSDAYHIPLLFSLQNVDVDALTKALQTLVQRHDSLRTCFKRDDAGIEWQQVQDRPLIISTQQVAESHFSATRQEALHQLFDLTNDYPIRAVLYSVGEAKQPYLFIVIHHIAFDAWSKSVFIAELDHLYRQAGGEKLSALPALPIQYADFARWQRQWLAAHHDSLTAYWQTALADMESTNFPTDFPRPSVQDYRGETVTLSIPSELSLKLKQLAESERVTLFTVMLTGFAITVAKYTGQETIMIGTPCANRQHAKLSHLIGFFVNLLPLNLKVKHEQRLLDCMHGIHDQLIAAQCHQDLPFAQLVESLRLTPDASRHPLFQLLFNMEYLNESAAWQPITIPTDNNRSKLDLSVSIQVDQTAMMATIQYATSLFKPELIQRFTAHYESVLTALAGSTLQVVSQVSLLSSADFNRLIVDWNDTALPYPHDKTIHELVAECAAATPDHIAIVFENEQLTYRQLNEKANQFARHIRKQQVISQDTLILLCVERSLEMVISLLAILKAGAAYVPIEPHYPTDRIRYILDDTNCTLVITQSSIVPHLTPAISSHIHLLLVDQAHYQQEATDDLPPYSEPHDLAYVIYTSGTTGLPKGVMIEHSGLCNIVTHIPAKLGLNADSRLLQFASIAFDASALQIFNALTIGATLYIVPEAIRQDADALAIYLKQHKITYAGLPPALLAHLKASEYPDLKTLVVAGEAAKSIHMLEWRPGRLLVNAYGPTENTIGACLHHYEIGDVFTNIGRPLANVQTYILDNQLQPVPVGVVGELYVGGCGVARGYLNQPALTAQCFIANPFVKNARLYKTGDLVRWLADGSIEFIGRRDFQVKIRGYRIELNEIEHIILQFPGVQQCVVVYESDKLAAYFISQSQLALTEIKNFVAARVPSYMMPNAFVALDSFPLTANGKLNRKALPIPTWQSETADYVPPQSEIETICCAIWQDTLSVERVGIQDDFFQLGGHSILAIHVAHRMSQATHSHIAVADIFKARTIAGISALLSTHSKLVPIELNAADTAPLSYAQERLWFIEQYEGGTNAYHMTLLLALDADCQHAALKEALQSIAARHEIWRSLIVQDAAGQYVQQVQQQRLTIMEMYVTHATLQSTQQAIADRPFDLTAEYPIRSVLFKLDDNEFYLFLVIHHAAFDAWSKTIFLNELAIHYQHQLDASSPTLPPLSIQYTDFAVWQRQFIAERHDDLLAYWQQTLKNHEPLTMPTDFPRPLRMNDKGESADLDLPIELVEQLQAVARTHQLTLYTVLLGAYALLLAKYSDQRDFVIGMPVMNRQHPQLGDLLGLFVNSIPIRIHAEPDSSIHAYLEQLQQTLQSAQSHQDLPFEQLVNGLALPRDTSRHPLFQVMFTSQQENEVIKSETPPPWSLIPFYAATQTAKFDLAVSIQVTPCITTVSIQYATALYKAETIARQLAHYETILNQLAAGSVQCLRDVTMLTAKERQTLLVDWNETNTPYPDTKTIDALFAEAASQYPDNIAVVDQHEKITYHDLDQASNQLARAISKNYSNGVLPADSLIPICTTRSIDFVIGVLAILKAGGAYVPVDASYPESRLRYIFTETACKVIVTQSAFSTIFNAITDATVICMDDKSYQQEDWTALSSTHQATNLAYVLYTSGTTGSPKGVMIEHRSVNCLLHSRMCAEIDAQTKGTLWSAVTFDVSVYELFSPLVKGGECHILDDETRLNEAVLFEYIVTKQITSLYLPPFFVYKIASALQATQQKVALKNVLLGVEPIQADQIQGFISHSVSVINAYGPTETTVSSTAYQVPNNHALSNNRISIGRPLNNEAVYVFDSALMPVSVGIIGELYISGDGLARGYLNQPELTNEKFIINPFHTHPRHARLYKTGDLVRWNAAGELDYIGRNDSQVKLNGYRIELSEIEQTLLKHPNVKECRVILREKMNAESTHGVLVAYYTGVSGDEKALSRFLAESLPDYMIPLAFVHLDAFCYTTNGKLDHAHLPMPELQIDDSFVAARNELEITLCRIWESLLNVTPIGITHDFFQLGGDSITSIQLISTLRYAGIHCSIKDIFQYRTIERLAEQIKTKTRTSSQPAEQGILSGSFNLLPIQHWFFEQDFSMPSHWNQAFLVRVPVLSRSRLSTILPLLINQHDMLRCHFDGSKQSYSNNWHPAAILSFTLHNNNQQALVVQLNEWQASLDLKNGPLWQLAYIDGFDDGSARLFFTCHHLLIDAVSWRIIVDDLKRLYDGGTLGTKTHSVRQWQEALQAYAAQSTDEISYWQKQLNAKNEWIPSGIYKQSMQFDRETTVSLLHTANRAYHTKIEDLLLSALAIALRATDNNAEHAITLESHGREWINDALDVSATVGWFTALYPIKLSTHHSIKATLIAIKDCLRAVPNNGIGYGALTYYSSDSRLKNVALPPIYFNYLGQWDTANQDWSICAGDTGNSIHADNTYDYMIMLNAWIVEGELRIEVKTKLDATTGQQLCRHFQSAIDDIITHCLVQIEQGVMTYTTGDFKSVRSEADLYHLPVHHDPQHQYQPFAMTSIQKAYTLGRLAQFEIGNIANHVYAEFSYPELNSEKLELALNQLIILHPELRTVFEPDHLQQRYLPYDESLRVKIHSQVIDSAYHPEAVADYRAHLSSIVYDVTAYPLFEFRVTHFTDRTILHISFDLLLLDAQSRMKFFNELTQLYQQPIYSIPQRAITFRDYQCYMDLVKTSPWYQADRAYWQEKLSRLVSRPKLRLNTDPSTIDRPQFQLSKRLVAAHVWKAFKQQAEQRGLSVAAVLLSLYGYIIARYADNSDFLITMTLFNRYGIHPDVNELWGDFTSTNLFNFSRKDGSANSFFKHTHDQLWDDIAHALYTGLEVQRDLMNKLQLEPTIAVSPLVFTCVVGDKQQRPETLPYFIQSDELVDERYWIGQTSQAWIDLQATERDGCFSSCWLYVSQLFSAELINHFNETYCNLIEFLANHSWDTPLPTTHLLTYETDLIVRANSNQQCTATATLIDLIEQQAATQGYATAVIDAMGQYDYDFVWKRSQQFAAELQQYHVSRSDLVAILCEKGCHQVVAALSIMMTGAAYLPLNVEWPIGRLSDVLIEGGVKHLVVTKSQRDTIKNTRLMNDYHIHCLDVTDSVSEQLTLHPVEVLPADLAYVIFTSGSTGKPKGVCISHSGAVNTIIAVNDRYAISNHDRVLALSELSFDLSVYDLFGTLAAGGVIVFPEQSLAKEPSHWLALIKQHNVTIWDSVPQLMKLLLDAAAAAEEQFIDLRLILLSGDWVPKALVSQLQLLPSNPKVVSLGGATEASIWSIWYDINDISTLSAIPYGYPMPNQSVYVLNAFGEHCPIDVAGDIYLGGDGLALGYYHDQEKTQLQFIQHEALGRLYKTGDRGKWHANGYIEFLGRNDNQIKRNGNRIELDEIAAKLVQLEGIDNALVRMVDERLVAYLVSNKQNKQHVNFNKEVFKIEQHAIRCDLSDNYSLSPPLEHENVYRRHKSYRQFSQQQLPDFLAISPVIANAKPTYQLTDLADLAWLLSPLCALTLNDKVLPKYRYPSAGSTYAVQCYLHIPNAIGIVEPGYYYFHPVLHTLQFVNKTLLNQFSLEFVAAENAIAPLYGRDWTRLAYIELGHMAYLLSQQLQQKNVGYEWEIITDNLPVLATLALNTQHCEDVNVDSIKTVILHKEGHSYKSADRVFDLRSESVFMQASEVGAILKAAPALVAFAADDNSSLNWIAAGYLAEQFNAQHHEFDLAICSLGYRPQPDIVYTLAIGQMRPEDEALAECQAQMTSFEETITGVISEFLPCYMVPQHFITLPALPLSSNGKIDFHALPVPDFTAINHDYIAPRTPLEETLCTVWQSVLTIPQIGIHDDFFKMGGDSILSIHVTTQLRQLGIECHVLWMFEYRSIDKLASHIALNQQKGSVLETIDYETDISDGLLARLQSRYERQG